MNIIGLVGRIARDPELRYTGNGNAVCNFPLAVDDPFSEGADFFDVTVWGKPAESTATYMSKGSQVAVNGRLKQEKWEKDGQTRSKVVVVAERVKFLDSGKKVSHEENPF